MCLWDGIMGSGGEGAGEGKTLQGAVVWEAGTVEGLLSHLQGNGLSKLVGVCPHSRSFRPRFACQLRGLQESGLGRECSVLGMPAAQPYHTPYPDSEFWTDL